jgi:hypothetical protein
MLVTRSCKPKRRLKVDMMIFLLRFGGLPTTLIVCLVTGQPHPPMTPLVPPILGDSWGHH